MDSAAVIEREIERGGPARLGLRAQIRTDVRIHKFGLSRYSIVDLDMNSDQMIQHSIALSMQGHSLPHRSAWHLPLPLFALSLAI